VSRERRKKKDGQDAGKKRRRMRTAVAKRKARATPGRPQRDEVDVVKYKQGSPADRTRRGAP
jgi:hypothetical protein